MKTWLFLCLLHVATLLFIACGPDTQSHPGPNDDSSDNTSVNDNDGSNNNQANNDNNDNDENNNDGDNNNNNDATDEAPVPVSTFSSINAVILQPRCGGCHGSSGGLTINYNNLINQPSNACPGSTLNYVIPGDPDNSVLIRKLEGTTCGPQMPRSGDKLTTEQIAPIRAWIEAGAHDN